MREVTEGPPPCVQMQFPATFKDLSTLNCCAITEVNELGVVGEASKICPCHKEPVLELTSAGELTNLCSLMLRATCIKQGSLTCIRQSIDVNSPYEESFMGHQRNRRLRLSVFQGMMTHACSLKRTTTPLDVEGGFV